MTGLSCLAIADVNRLMQWADVIGAMTFEALRGQLDAFDETIIALKPHPGMQQVGKNLRGLLAGSEVLANSKGIRTQDALSIRSIPQVHGATRDQLIHATNRSKPSSIPPPTTRCCWARPTLPGVSQANPHGQSVAMAADLLAIAMAELGSIAERRLDRLINPHVSGLPAFLVSQSGGQFRDDDRAIRRRFVVRRKPPDGATGGHR
jgi:histidine ammonia-lyase